MAPLEEFVKRTDLTDDIHYKVKLMLRNAQRLLRIVNNLMDLQKNESGTMKLQVSENDMIKFTHEAVSSFQDLALYRNIHLKFKHSIDCQPVWFDWNLLEKVYFNFLSNAFKNVPDGGTVSVELDVKPYSELTFFLPAKLNKYKNTEIRYLPFPSRTMVSALLPMNWRRSSNHSTKWLRTNIPNREPASD